MRLIAIALMAIVGLTCRAAEPLTTVVDSLPRCVGDLSYHVRAAADKGLLYMGISWDGGERTVVAEADLSEVYASDYGVRVKVTYTDQERNLTQTRCFDADAAELANGLSIKLIKIDDMGLVLVGCSKEADAIVALVDGKGGTVTTFVGPNTTITQHHLMAETIDCEERVDATLEELINALTQSSDSTEGLWEYLDRDTDPLRLTVGGAYRLAIVRQGDRYALVYVDGADVARNRWRAMRVKGWLEPTPFIGHYNLVWYDARGRRLDRETSATIADGTITFNFPLYGGKVRFYKLPIVRSGQ